MFARLFSAGAEKKNAYALYQALVNQARSIGFYTEMNVPDTIEGRFDMILLHLSIVDLRLEKEGEKFVRLRRFIQEAMVSDMDRSFRELGIGDMSVGKEMKKVGAALLGRKAVYKAAITSDEQQVALQDAVLKNIYQSEDNSGISKMISYIVEAVLRLDAQKLEMPSACTIEFPSA